MQSIVEHISQKYKGAIYSKPFYQDSVGGICTFNYDEQGAIAILTLFIYFLPITIPGPPVSATFTPITFTDQFGQVLMTLSSPGTGWAPLYQVTEGTRLRVVSNPVVPFQIAHQYLLAK